jgi:hypothetical protein
MLLDKKQRKRFLTQNWVDIMKQESNSSQAWHRIRDRANTVINDLILLSSKLPEEKQREIFHDKNIDRLMRSLISKHDEQPDARRTSLAATLVWLGTLVCISQYRFLMKDTPDLGKAAISTLNQSVAICRDIAYRTELMERDMEAEKQEMVYLFEWNKISTTKYTRRFADFIRKEVKYGLIDLGPIELSKDRKNIRGTFKETPFESEPSWSFIIELNDAKTTASFRAFDEDGNERARKILMVRKGYDDIVVYAKKKN